VIIPHLLIQYIKHYKFKISSLRMDLISLTGEQKQEHQKWKTLFETKYNFEFQNPAYESVPFVSNLIENPRAEKRLGRIENYLLSSYAINMGTNDHQEMRNIRQQEFTKEEYKWHQRHNKLGSNTWGSVAGIMLLSLNKLLERDDLLVVPRLPSPEEYSKMIFEEKTKYVKSIDEKLYALLERIYPEYE
jgi:hypothetical protein